MVKAILVLLAVIACPLLWTMIIVPLIAKSFGVPIKIGSRPIERRDQRISKRQSFWFAGVLGWGLGFSLLCTLLARFIGDKRPTILEDFFGFFLIVAFWSVLNQSDWTYPIDKKPSNWKGYDSNGQERATGRPQ